MGKAQRLVGIDFGTSTSVVRVKRYQDGEPIGDSYSSSGVTFGNGEGDTKAVTLVRRNEDGGYTCGAEAEEPVPGSTIFREFKMRLESPVPEEQAEARELTKAFFRYLFERYDHQRSDLGAIDDEERTLVSLPVKWREETRRFMGQAAKEAGFMNVTIMDEPTAALYAALCRKMGEINQQGLLRTGEPGYLLLVDMGAGTTDLAVCRYFVDGRPGEIIRADRIKNEIVVTWPEGRNAATFGGREVDRVLEDYVESFLTGCGLPEAMAGQFVRGGGNSAAKRWKENSVSKLLNEGKQVETCAFIANVMMLLPQQKPFPAFGREAFERILGEGLEQFRGLVAGCLQRASEAEPEVLAKGLDLVVLTGGHSAWYFVEEMMNGTMPGLELPQLERARREKSRVIRLTNPQETVALGLVYSQLPFQVAKQEEPAPEPEPAAGKHAAGKTAAAVTAPLPQRPDRSGVLPYGAWAETFINSYDAQFLKQVSRPGNVDNMRKYLFIPQSAKLYLIHDDTILGSGKNGFVLSDQGVFAKDIYKDAEHTSWEEFVRGELLPLEPGAGGCNIYMRLTDGSRRCTSYVTGGGEELKRQVFQFFVQLQEQLRQCAGQPPVQEEYAAPVYQADAGEVAALAADFIHHYDRATMEQVQRVGNEPVFRAWLMIPQDEVLYLAHDDTVLMSGKNGFAVGAQGIYCKNFGDPPQMTAWSEFLSWDITVTDNDGPTNLYLQLPTERRVITYLTGEKALRNRVYQFIVKLQQYLRQNAQQHT